MERVQTYQYLVCWLNGEWDLSQEKQNRAIQKLEYAQGINQKSVNYVH